MKEVDIRLLSNLADSLKARHLHDRKRFIEAYGVDMWERFGGMYPIIKEFLREVEDAVQS